VPRAWNVAPDVLAALAAVVVEEAGLIVDLGG